MSNKTRREDKWMQVCSFAAPLFSTCGKRQYFAIILDTNGRVLGTGFNGAPPKIRHCTDGGCPRFGEGSPPGSSYDNCIAIHAEENALLWSDRSLRVGSTLIVNGPPCYGCSKKIAGSGIARVVYLEDPTYADFERSLVLLMAAGVQCRGVRLAGEGPRAEGARR